MTIIVTGAGGFVGRALIVRLLENGHSVVGVDTQQGQEQESDDKNYRRVVGDLSSPYTRRQIFETGCDALVHLATVPGGAAERDPVLSRRVNVDAMYDLLLDASANFPGARVVYASSIAVFGDPLPAGGVDDHTPIAPKMIYGAHKAMMEVLIASLSERGEIDGVTVRLPGVLARPKMPTGLKSAFMSDLFHAARAGQNFVCPVSAGATIWAQSVGRCVDNLAHALTVEASVLPRTRAVTLPALRIAMSDLVTEVAQQCGTMAALVNYRPDPQLEAAFGRHPVLRTDAADLAGFIHDGELASLVSRALYAISTESGC